MEFTITLTKDQVLSLKASRAAVPGGVKKIIRRLVDKEVKRSELEADVRAKQDVFDALTPEQVKAVRRQTRRKLKKNRGYDSEEEEEE